MHLRALACEDLFSRIGGIICIQIFSDLLCLTINPHSLRHKSHRSPWSNEYDPPLEDGTVPSPRIRKMEITANEAFDTYREMYVLEWNERAVFLIYSSIALQVL